MADFKTNLLIFFLFLSLHPRSLTTVLTRKEKLFRCEFCRKRFGLRSYLVKHYEVGACAKRKNGAQTAGGKRSGRSAKDEDPADFDFKSEEQVKQRMKSLVQELKKEEEAEQRERAANKQENGKGDESTEAGASAGRKRRPQKVRKCNVMMSKPISLEEYDDDEYDESEDEQEVVNNKSTRSRNGNYAKINNEHDYSVSNGDKEEDEQIIEINGEIIKGAQIVYVADGKELTDEDGQQVATIQVLNGTGDLIETAEVVTDF